MHVIYLVRRVRKYHTDQSQRIYSVDSLHFYPREGRHFDLWPLAVRWRWWSTELQQADTLAARQKCTVSE